MEPEGGSHAEKQRKPLNVVGTDRQLPTRSNDAARVTGRRQHERRSD